MAVTITLGEAQAVHTVSALEKSIDSMMKFCRETDEKFGYMNNMHKNAMRELLEVHTDLVRKLRDAGYRMEYIEEYDMAKPEWQDIPLSGK